MDGVASGAIETDAAESAQCHGEVLGWTVIFAGNQNSTKMPKLECDARHTALAISERCALPPGLVAWTARSSAALIGSAA